MQIVLLVAAAVSLVVTRNVPTAVVLAGLTVFNAVIGLRQEAKAEESLAGAQADAEDDRDRAPRRPAGRRRCRASS